MESKIDSVKDQYKEMMQEDIRIKSNNNTDWLYLTEYQTELAIFCARECLLYIDRHGMDESFGRVKKAIFINATIAMMELAPWIFNEMAATVSRDQLEMMLAHPKQARMIVEQYFDNMASRPALTMDWERFDLMRHLASSKD